MTAGSCTAGKLIGRARRARAVGLRRPYPAPDRPSLGESVHGNGVHLDDYETHDDAAGFLLGAGFTFEARPVFRSFGVRTEINVFRGERDARFTGRGKWNW